MNAMTSFHRIGLALSFLGSLLFVWGLYVWTERGFFGQALPTVEGLDFRAGNMLIGGTGAMVAALVLLCCSRHPDQFGDD